MIQSIHPEADSEFAAAADFYNEREEGLGDNFSEEVFATIDRIISFPNSLASKFLSHTTMPV